MGARAWRVAGALALLCGTSAPPAWAAKVPKTGVLSLADVTHTDAQPLVDGGATSLEEWEDGAAYPHLFGIGKDVRSGWCWLEQRDDWDATSVQTASRAVVPGRTLFVALDMTGSADPKSPLHGLRVQEDSDWASLSLPTPRGTVTIWVLAGADDPDDADWLEAAGGLASSVLVPEGPGANGIDDRGFVVRLDGDPSTDRHWFPGDPEPGDSGWDPEDFYGCFGRASFGQSFQDVGLDLDPADAAPHETYEVACTYPPAEPPQDSWWWPAVVLEAQGRLAGIWLHRGGFWLHFHEPPPLVPVGQPPVGDRFRGIGQKLQEKALELAYSNPTAGDHLKFAAASFFDVFAAIEQGDLSGAGRTVPTAIHHIDEARRNGADDDEVRNQETHGLAATRDMADLKILELALGGAGTPIGTFKSSPGPSDALAKAYKALRAAGKKLESIRQSGGEPSGLWMAAMKQYAKALGALEDSSAGP